MKPVIRMVLIVGSLLAAVVALGPILWALSTSLKATNKIFAVPPELIPAQPTLDHYGRLISEGVHWAFLNSGLYAFAAVAISLLLGTVAGYALARYPIPGKQLVLVHFVGAMAVPGFAVLLPTQRLFVDLQLYNTYVALPLLYAGHILPFAVWVTRSHFSTLPRELEQAAQIDGYSRFEAVCRAARRQTSTFGCCSVRLPAFMERLRDGNHPWSIRRRCGLFQLR